MKPFQSESGLAVREPRQEMAPRVIEVSALVMRRVRAAIRRGGEDGLSFTQMRSLFCLHHTPGLSLSEVSEFLGIGAPTTSKTIEELVQEGLVRRETAADDRRRVTLHATEEGERALALAGAPAHRELEDLFESLSDADRDVVERAMELLLPLVKPAVRTGEDGNE
jgi:DNA-binding MarR family transcriptional regulator